MFSKFSRLSKLKFYAAASLMALSSVSLLGASKAYADGWNEVHFSSDTEAPSYQVASDYYKPFLTNNPIVRIKTKTINLQIDKAPNPVGSVVVKFVSAQTCSNIIEENCVTTILKYNSTAQAWQEVWNHSTKEFFLGIPDYDAVMYKQEGGWYHTLYSTDGLKWRWINLEQTFYEPDPFGDNFADFASLHPPVPAPKRVTDFVTKTFDWPTNITYNSQQVDLDDKTNKPAYIIYPEGGPFCGSLGCLATLLISGGEHKPYRIGINKGVFMYNREGFLVKNNKNVADQEYKDIIIRSGTQLDGYVYSKSLKKYVLLQTTYHNKSALLP